MPPCISYQRIQELVDGIEVSEEIREALKELVRLRTHIQKIQKPPMYDCGNCGLPIQIELIQRAYIACPDCNTYTAKLRM